MNITIHAPVRVRLKKLFKISVYFSLAFEFFTTLFGAAFSVIFLIGFKAASFF
jgi:hypothetical protein